MSEKTNIENNVPEQEQAISAEEMVATDVEQAQPMEAEEEEGYAVSDVDSRKLSDKYAKLMGENGKTRTKLTGLFRDWFLDYASYVILERAVPYIDDGLKPVQRRILHSMRRMYDGSRIKVANIVGHTMQFHPHGDASIYETMVRLTRGYAALLHPLVDSKGSFGKQYSSDMKYAASRYTEAKLSKLSPGRPAIRSR